MPNNMAAFNGNFHGSDDRTRNLDEIINVLERIAECGASGLGSDGKSPYIGGNGNWYTWDGVKFIDTEVSAKGQDGKSPYIGANRNWFTWNGTEFIDTGVSAQGQGGSGQTEQVINLSGIYVGSTPPDDKSVIWATPVTDIS